MKDLELQERIDQTAASNHLVIADFNVMLWKILDFYGRHEYLFKREENRIALIKLGVSYIFNKGPIGLNNSQARVIVIADNRAAKYGGYWRHYEVARDVRIKEAWDSFRPKTKLRNYKDGRGDKSELFYKAFKIAKEYCETYLSFYEFEGFEADDIAGAIYRNLKDKHRVKIFYTVDRDWAQLVKEEDGWYWYTPRVSKPNEWFLDQAMKNEDVIYYAERKLDYPGLEHPCQLINAKVEAGDLGDNLPPGTPAIYMDLINPHEQYCIEKLFSEKFNKLILDCECEEPNANSEHLAECDKMFKKLKLSFNFLG